MTAYPPAPWLMHGSMWLTVLRLGHDVDPAHPAGIYGVALVDYQHPSPLTYGELLLARTTSPSTGAGKRRRDQVVTITDIWVDSPASVAGGRELWAIPKELCDFDKETVREGVRTTTRWQASTGLKPIVAAEFHDVSKLAPRVPFKGKVEQPGIPEHPDVAEVVMKGTAKASPCRAHWQFTADGPLAFLNDARQLGSFRMRDFRLHFR
jgi:acetoacetate decarboxylase